MPDQNLDILRQRAEQMGEEGNYRTSGINAMKALEEFHNRIINATELQDRLDRIDAAKRAPLQNGDWISFNDGRQQWRFEGMGFGNIEDLRKTAGLGRNTLKPFQTTDGTLFETMREAKKHELATVVTANLQRDCYLPKPLPAAA